MEMKRLAEFVESVKVMPLRPTDVIVFRCNRTLSSEQLEWIKAKIRTAIEVDNKVLVIDGSCDIEIVRPEAVAA